MGTMLSRVALAAFVSVGLFLGNSSARAQSATAGAGSEANSASQSQSGINASGVAIGPGSSTSGATSESRSGANAAGAIYNPTTQSGASAQGGNADAMAGVNNNNKNEVNPRIDPTIQTMSGSESKGNTTETNQKQQTNAAGNVINQNFEGSEAPDLGDQVPTVIPPNLVASYNNTCFGSTTAGVAGSGFGISLGSTWEDQDCQRRLFAQALWSMATGTTNNSQRKGMLQDAALQMLCFDNEVQRAVSDSGGACPAQKRQMAAAEMQERGKRKHFVSATAVADSSGRPNWCSWQSAQEVFAGCGEDQVAMTDLQSRR